MPLHDALQPGHRTYAVVVRPLVYVGRVLLLRQGSLGVTDLPHELADLLVMGSFLKVRFGIA